VNSGIGPVLAAIPLDDTTPEVVSAALGLARRLETSVLPVHAIALYPFPTARHEAADADAPRAAMRAAFAAAAAPTDRVEDAVVAESSSAAFILDVAIRSHASMIVVGGGHGPTLGGWVLGTVADRVARSARCPVFVARGALPGPERAILCPVDLTPHASVGLEAALRMARLWEAPLRVLTVLPRAHATSLAALGEEADRLERATHEELSGLLRAHDVRGVQLEVRVVGGDAAEEITLAAQTAGLVVLASRGFDMLVPASFGDVASRVLRNARCSVLAIRDLDPDVGARERVLSHVVKLRDEARRALENGELARAERALIVASSLSPGHAVIEDDLAVVCDRAGRAGDAARHRDAARILRSFHA